MCSSVTRATDITPAAENVGAPAAAASKRRPRRIHAITDDTSAIAHCCAPRYTFRVIKSFHHKGLKALYETGSAKGVQPTHAKRLRMQLAALDTARSADDMNIPGWRLHPLKGAMAGRWSITVNGNWRVTFEFRDGNAYVLDYEDYH